MPSPFDLTTSLERAESRLRAATPTRRRRSDTGKQRIEPAVARQLRRLLADDEYPKVESLLTELRRACRKRHLACPSRATVYKFIQSDPGKSYPAATLPAEVCDVLYNLSPEGTVPGAQLAFYCFNYGGLAALHFAAALPWLPLCQAYRMRGWRAKSRGLLRAVLVARGIPSD
jgi:hypothetical protein